MDVLRQSGKCCLAFHKRLLEQYAGICKLWVNTSVLVLINDPDLVRDCLMSNIFLEKPFFYKFFRTPFGLLNSDYHYWRENRKLVNPTFNSKILTSFMPIFIEKSEQMIGKLAKRAEGGDEFNIFPYISNCTLKTVFGKFWLLCNRRV
jgi:cytochrome P450